MPRGQLTAWRWGTATFTIGGFWEDAVSSERKGPVATAIRSTTTPPAFADSMGIAATLTSVPSPREQRVDIGNAIIKTPTLIDQAERRIEQSPIVKT